MTDHRRQMTLNRLPTTGKCLLFLTVIGLRSSVIGLRSSVIGLLDDDEGMPPSNRLTLLDSNLLHGTGSG